MNKDILKEGIARGLTHKSLASENDVSASTIDYWLRKYQLKTKHRFRDGSGLVRARRERLTPLARRYDWRSIQAFYDAGRGQKPTAKQFNMALKTLRKGIEEGFLIKRTKEQELVLASKLATGVRHTKASKNVMSEKRKAYLKRESKPAWKTNAYHKSRPCEYLKNTLRSRGIAFLEELQPLLNKGRFFSLDIAFPQVKIGIEVNGRQHYNADGTLAPYYQKRHDLIVAEGWKLIEVPYHKATTSLFIEEIVKMVPLWGVEPTT